MKHVIALTVEDVQNPIEIEVSEETFKKFAKFSKDFYPEKNWNTVSDSYNSS